MNPSLLANANGQADTDADYPTWDPQTKDGRDRFQQLLDTDSESTGVYTCDAGGVITYYNSQAAELWGRKPELGDTDGTYTVPT